MRECRQRLLILPGVIVQLSEDHHIPGVELTQGRILPKATAQGCQCLSIIALLIGNITEPLLYGVLHRQSLTNTPVQRRSRLHVSQVIRLFRLDIHECGGFQRGLGGIAKVAQHPATLHHTTGEESINPGNSLMRLGFGLGVEQLL